MKRRVDVGGVGQPDSLRQRPAGRYDDQERWPLVRQRVLAVLLTVLVAALVVAVVKTLWDRRSDGSVDGRVLGYNVASDERVDIRFEVFKKSGEQAFCIVRSRGADGAEVGRDVVTVDSAGNAERRVPADFSLDTTSRAVTGELAGCSSLPIDKDPAHHDA